MQQVRLTVTTNNVEDLINDMKSSLVYMSNTIALLNGLITEMEDAWRCGRVLDVSREDVARMQKEAEDNLKAMEAAKEDIRKKATEATESGIVGLIPGPEGKAIPGKPGDAFIPTDPRMRGTPSGPHPSKKKNR